MSRSLFKGKSHRLILLSLALSLILLLPAFIYTLQVESASDNVGDAPHLTFTVINTGGIKNDIKNITDATRSMTPHSAHQYDHSMQLIPIDKLVQSTSAAGISCPDGSSPILDTHNPNTKYSDSKIPRIVHITSKSRCAPPPVHAHVNQWRFANYSLYFHDDNAVERLNSHPLSQSLFPLLNETLKCVTNGATKSDLWRYLVLYTYGGVYTDVDNSPIAFGGTTIQPTDDCFLVIESLGIMAQYFIASSPAHPLMKLSLDYGMASLRRIPNVMRNNPAQNTGPGAIKNGFVLFMNHTSNGYIGNGTYVGIGDSVDSGNRSRSCTVVGDKRRSQEYINRGGLRPRFKAAYYKAMGMEHFHDNHRFPNKGSISCMQHLHRTNGTHSVAKYRFEGTEYVVDE